MLFVFRRRNVLCVSDFAYTQIPIQNQKLDYASNSVYLMIFENMLALRKVAVTVAFLPKQSAFYLYLNTSKTITDLCVIFEHSDRSVEHLLLRFRHLECLRAVIGGYSPPLFGYSHPIGMFALREVRPDLSIHLFDLKSLYYEQNGGLWYLHLLPELYPFLEMISLSEIFYPHVTEEVICALKEFDELKHVRIRGGRKSMAKFYSLINKAKLHRIKTVEIVVASYHETSEKVFHLKMTAEGILEPCNFLTSTIF